VRVLTIGHSTRAIEAFLRLLTSHHVARLVDVRTIPQSRRHPQFGKERLAESLAGVSIAYTHLPGLGGLRKPRPDSANTAWRNASFRGYADYMQTAAFRGDLEALMAMARIEPVAIMCAEAVPWRCHRSLIADALIARGVRAEEIVSERTTRPHKLSDWARVENGNVTYPGVEV
jgi:uncharacterized protein (DUF488 family)